MAKKFVVATSHAPSTRKRRRAARARARSEHRSAAGAASAGAAIALGLGLHASEAHAASFEVTNLDDAGAGSLRQAIADANGAAGADIITFQSGLTGTITLSTGVLEISDAVDIQGPGAAMLTISGNDASGVFALTGPDETEVLMSGLRITGGNASSGGGIFANTGRLTVEELEIVDNAATDDGGGIASNAPGGVIVRNSLISENTATSEGGGILAQGDFTIEDSQVSDNFVGVENQTGGEGGGLSLDDPSSATILRVTIDGNTSRGVGGGIYFEDPHQTMTIRESTISGNTALENGGGIFAYLYEIEVRIENSTISGNQAANGGGLYVGFYYDDQGDFRLVNCTIAGNTATATGGGLTTRERNAILDNTIVADNTAPTDPDVATFDGAEIAANYSLIETVGAATVSGANNVTGMDPQLAALAANGGPSQTHLPANASPAVNAGDPALTGITVDQRGLERVFAGRVDIGAVETHPGTLQCTMAAYSASEADGTVSVVVSRTGGSDGAIGVAYASADGTAAQPGDYTTASGTLQWTAGETANKTIAVTLASDGDTEGDETFTVTLSNPTGAVLGTPAVATVTITNTATAPTISAIGDQTLDEDEASTAIAFTIGDPNTAVGSLTVSAASSNDALVPDSAVVLGGSGTDRTVQVTPAQNQNGTTDITVSVSDGATTTTETFTVTVTAAYDAATISAIGDQTVSEGQATSAIPFTLGDPDGKGSALVVSASSSNTSLVPNANIELGGSGTSRTVKVTPAADQSGTATITISVADGTGTITETFTVTVTGGSDAPTISSIADQTIDEDTSTDAIAFTIGDPDTDADDLTLTAMSSNTTLVRTSGIVFGGSGEQRTVRVIPAEDATGDVNVTIQVSDGTNSAMETFKLTVNPVSDPVPDAGEPDAGEPDAGVEEPTSDDDCSCRAVGQSKAPSGSLTTTMLAMVGFAAWRKRRRAKRSGSGSGE